MTKKRFLLALALMLTAVGGAWAQNTVTWTQADLSGINLVSGQSTTISGVTLTANNGSVYMDGAGALFFNGNNNEGFTFSVAEGSITQIVITASMFNVSAAGWTVDGTETQATWTGNAQSVNFGTAVLDVSSIEFTITGGNSTGVDVNWNAATKTGSLTVPAGNVTLTVDYYGQYTLDSVPTAEGWQVKVNGLPATVTPYSPGSALGHVDNINETDSVELIPPAELRGTIKAVRLTESVALQPVTLPESTVGMVVGSDGFAYPAGVDLPTGVFMRAVVAYKDGEHGLAITTMDQGGTGIPGTWADQKSACEGNTAIAGATWRMASQDDWQQMFTANGGSNSSSTGLNTLITAAGGFAVDGSYWTSTEESKWGQDGADFVYVNGSSVTYDFDGGLNNSRRARAVLAW